MRQLELSCPAKINLGLYLTGRRPDGYHLLETLMYPVPAVADTLILSESGAAYPTLELGGIPVPGEATDNLVLRAWELLRAEVGGIPGVLFRLEKRIPAGAGLGGGSSDAAQALIGMCRLWELPLSPHQLLGLAMKLGADVPFFLRPEPQLARGIGEILEPYPLQLEGFRVEIQVLPGLHSDTAQAYRSLRPDDFLPKPDLVARLARPVEDWPSVLHNTFERPVFERFPELAAAKASLYAQGAVYASLSGSGSALFGLFPA